MAVFETDDESLLLTVRRRWGWKACYEVMDADDGLRGTFQPMVAGPIWIYPFAGELSGVPLTELAAFTPGPDGTLLSFATAIQGNPFIKMVALAAALLG
jgi:hypothetical protein